ncbi:MAG: hypothetical protein HQ483_16780 [Rhodospirillales bacterium]|nr:hypothetical protein [Rhodospirillales bacterium]
MKDETRAVPAPLINAQADPAASRPQSNYWNGTHTSVNCVFVAVNTYVWRPDLTPVFETDSAAAREHPLIQDFCALICATVGDGLLEFKDIQARPFMKFWKNFIIYRYEPAEDDFRVVFYGSHVASMYGADHTGKLLSEMGFNEVYQEVHTLNKRIIDGDQQVFASGTLFWQNKKYRIWHQAKLPMKRDGGENEILVLMDYE